MPDQASTYQSLSLRARRIASRSALRRFEYESQILGRLKHPGIAQIYEAGTWAHEGVSTPFFAMEFVQGVTIVRYVHPDDDDESQMLGSECTGMPWPLSMAR